MDTQPTNTLFKTTYSKVLLFGEHIVNKGAKAIAIPLDKYRCQLTYDSTMPNILEDSAKILFSLLEFIRNDVLIRNAFDVDAFENDIKHGLKIAMNIPIGYGLGSSGALTAILFDTYVANKTMELQLLKTQLGAIESFFHGKSSGLDPLVSYLNKPILIEAEVTKPVVINSAVFDALNIFLINTNTSRKTSALVNAFLAKADSNEDFNRVLTNEMIPLNNQIIEQITTDNGKPIDDLIKQLSAMQLQNFKLLILEEHLNIWKIGIESNDFYLKICGAGGGGFMLAFAKNDLKLKEYFAEKDIISLGL